MLVNTMFINGKWIGAVPTMLVNPMYINGKW